MLYYCSNDVQDNINQTKRERDYIPYEFDKIQMKKLDSHSNNNNSNNKNNSIHLRNPANL